MDDFLFDSGSGAFLDITISGAAAGIFDFEGWFYDSALTTQSVVQDILVSTDGGNNFAFQASAAPLTKSLSPTAFSVAANGTDDVVIRIQENNSFDQMRINGFAISQKDPPNGVPEPATGVLLALGLLGMGFARKRRAY